MIQFSADFQSNDNSFNLCLSCLLFSRFVRLLFCVIGYIIKYCQKQSILNSRKCTIWLFCNYLSLNILKDSLVSNCFHHEITAFGNTHCCVILTDRHAVMVSCKQSIVYTYWKFDLILSESQQKMGKIDQVKSNSKSNTKLKLKERI